MPAPKSCRCVKAWACDLVLKVKEPLKIEYPFLMHQILFTYLHLSGVEKSLTETLLARGTTAIAYETVEDANGRLPLLAPMSGVAGTMAVTMGELLARQIQRRQGHAPRRGDGALPWQGRRGG